MIDLRGITQIYQGPQGPVEALRGIDLHITPGEVFGIIGRSGAGKSSLVRVINLLNRPTRGEVIVAGRDLTRLSDADLRAARRDIGMCSSTSTCCLRARCLTTPRCRWSWPAWTRPPSASA